MILNAPDTIIQNEGLYHYTYTRDRHPTRARLHPVPTFKFLGTSLDKRLTFNQHISNTIKIANTAARLQNRFIFANRKTKLQLYKAIILPHLLYSPLSHILSSKTLQYKTQIIQNKALRHITRADRHTTNKDIHIRLKIPPINYHNYLRLGKITDKLTEDPLYRNIKNLDEHRPPIKKHQYPTSDCIPRPIPMFSYRTMNN